MGNVARIFFFFLFPVLLVGLAQADDWQALAPGLELREFVISNLEGDTLESQGSLAVLRIDLTRFDLVLGAALKTGRSLPMPEWVRQHGFVAAINAAMFRADDRLRSTGFMRDNKVVVNSFMHPDYGAFLVFQPQDPSLPAVRWVDRKQDDDWQDILAKYNGVIQNYRLISRDRQNLWEPTLRRHSVAAVAMDQQDRLFFIHSRPPLSLHEFAQALLDLPLNLVGAMYVEGGADAAMYVQVNNFTGRWVGEYQTDFFQSSNKHFWPTPNVLGLRLK